MALNYRKVFLILLPILSLFTALVVEVKTDLSAFLISGENAEEILLASEMQSGALSSRYILSIDAGKGAVVDAVFTRQLIKQLAQIDAVQDVWSQGQARFSADALQAVYAPYGAYLYSRHAAADLPELLTENGLRQRAEFLKTALLSPQGNLIKKIALQDPLLLSLSSFQSLLDKYQSSSERNPRYQNLILQSAKPGMDVPAQQEIVKQIRHIFSTYSKTSGLSYQLDITGVPIFATHTYHLVANDITRVSLLSSLSLVLLFFCLFRSFGVLFWVVAILLAVVTVSVLMTYLVFGGIHGMTLAIGTTLVGICIDYPIHGLVHAQSEKDQPGRSNVIARIWPSMLMGGLTTLVGYTALGSSGYPGFQQIAVYAGTGILVSLLLTRYFLPTLNLKSAYANKSIILVNRWANFCSHYRTIMVMIVLLLLVMALLSLRSLHWIEDLQELTPELAELKATDKAIRSRMLSSIEPGRFILVSDKHTQAALEKAETIYPVLDQLKEQGALADYFGIYPWLLSKRQQQKNQKLLQQMVTEQIQQEWHSALKQQDLSVQRLGSLQYINQEKEPFGVQHAMASPAKYFLENQLIITKNQTLLMIWVAQHDPAVLRKALNNIPGVLYFSQRDLLNQMAAEYQSRAQLTLQIGLVIILLLLLLRYRNILTTLRTVFPALIAAVFILAGWSLSQQAISFLHLVGFLLAVAICVDYGIFYQENRSGNIALTYQAMAASMLTSVLAFSCLAAANTASLQILGQVVALGVVLGFLLCPVIIKPSPNRVTDLEHSVLEI